MLSILIPIYHFNVIELVKDLHRQASQCNVEFEILCVDDGSDQAFQQENVALKEMNQVVYSELSANIGRSKIRNLLAQKAQYPYLLFLDCDSTTVDTQFISRYINHLSKDGLVYGGRCYEKHPPKDARQYFRWWYGVNRETISARQRVKQPYHSFMTNNFLIPKSIFNEVQLDETIKGYGHEDTLFGLELKKRGIAIHHIDNPLCHIGLETFEEYMDKTKEGIRNLKKLMDEQKVDRSVKLYRYYSWVQKIGVATTIFNYFNKNERLIIEKLKTPEPHLKWFDLYKLGYLISLTRF